MNRGQLRAGDGGADTGRVGKETVRQQVCVCQNWLQACVGPVGEDSPGQSEDKLLVCLAELSPSNVTVGCHFDWHLELFC